MEFNGGTFYAQRVCPIEIIGRTGFVRMREYVSGQFGRHGQQRWGLGAGHVRQEHSMHAFTSITLSALP